MRQVVATPTLTGAGLTQVRETALSRFYIVVARPAAGSTPAQP